MEFSWNDMTIEWFENASEYTGFHRNLAQAVKPMLNGGKLCDLGCGLGKLDLELAECTEQLICLDINALAISNLQQNIRKRNITNIDARVQDCEQLTEQSDILLMSYFGSVSLRDYLDYCRKMIVIVDHRNKTHLYPDEYKKNIRKNSQDIKSLLDQDGVRFSYTTHELEFGQPFESKDSAGEFVSAYAKCPEGETADFLGKNLLPIDRGKYRWYLPHKKSLAIFRIERRGKGA